MTVSERLFGLTQQAMGEVAVAHRLFKRRGNEPEKVPDQAFGHVQIGQQRVDGGSHQDTRAYRPAL